MFKLVEPQRSQVVNFFKGMGLVFATFLLYWIATLLFCSTCYGQDTAATTPAKPSGLKPSYLNPYALGMNTQSMGLKAFFDAVERINKPDSCLTKKAVGKVGLGLAVQTNSTVFVNATAKTNWGGYVTLLAGRRKNELYVGAQGQYKANPSLLAGIGFVARPHIFIGGLAGASFYQEVTIADNQPTRYAQLLQAGKLKPVLLYGVQVSAELRHVWVSVNLLSGSGIGIGATYFF
ncbi:hypothetical protein [Spirosoma pollinicola]|uniref:Uncharacterized protein n=1 Tax=Spirosoma pollinicola TaxID=2057025 RepID=A0A2K8Z2X7_9BACT|nr:hypothetical protein [Spirosoma pollinicola]AUD04215.1 hypothetical protein CWM47_21665 [Spirosoma pollinicola]